MSVEEQYQKLSHKDQILKRPDTYVGSVEQQDQEMWVALKTDTDNTRSASALDDTENIDNIDNVDNIETFDSVELDQSNASAASETPAKRKRKIAEKKTVKMVKKTITYTPGLYKIFDEILVNASDNFQRDPKQTTIKVEIDADEGKIVVYNDGEGFCCSSFNSIFINDCFVFQTGIPVVIHKKENVYVPELIFGHLLTGTNYNDDVKKVTGGRNGYGAKLANIFSTKFIVETADGTMSYKQVLFLFYNHLFMPLLLQVWKNNMSDMGEAVIKPSKNKFTKITFYPELSRFQMSSLDQDTMSLLIKRVYDIAACNIGKKVSSISFLF